MSSHQQNAPPTFFFDDAFCSEDDEIIDPINFTSKIFLNNFSENDEELGVLLNKEKMMTENEILMFDETKPRNASVEWILKVVEYYSFSAKTAVLAVAFLDRFLSKIESQKNPPWKTHLAAVACLSLAAKVEETHVPLLLDLQVLECKYVFEPKTIQRMELVVLSTLEWKMNPVTPVSFLDFITKRLCLEEAHLCEEFILRYESILLSLITDCRYMCHLPSALATATMVSVISSVEPCIGEDCLAQLIGILGIINNKDKVEDCLRLIQQVQSSSKRRFNGTLFYTPKGVVMDHISSSTLLSSDNTTSSNSSSSSTDHDSSVVNSSSSSSSPEHLNKRIKSNSSIS